MIVPANVSVSLDGSVVFSGRVDSDTPTSINLPSRYAVFSSDRELSVVTTAGTRNRIEVELDDDVLALVSINAAKVQNTAANLAYRLLVYNGVDLPSSCPSDMNDQSHGCPSAYVTGRLRRYTTLSAVKLVRAGRLVVETGSPQQNYMALHVQILGVYDGMSLTPLTRGAELLDLPTKHYFADAPITLSCCGQTRELSIGDEMSYANGQLWTWNQYVVMYAYNGVNGLLSTMYASRQNTGYTVQLDTDRHVDAWGAVTHASSADLNYASFTHSLRINGLTVPVARAFFSSVTTYPYRYSAVASALQVSLGANNNGCWVIDAVNAFVY